MIYHNCISFFEFDLFIYECYFECFFVKLKMFLCIFELAIPLAKSQCQTERCGRYGSSAEDC